MCNNFKSIKYFYNTKISIRQKLFVMNTNAIGYWNEKKEKLKQKYTVITDDDVNFCDGKEKEMMEMLGYKLGKTKDELRNILVVL